MEIAKETHIEKPKKYTENIFGYKVRTPRDFEALTTNIFNNAKQMISLSTIKRLWGYLIEKEGQTPRLSTFKNLTRYTANNICNKIGGAKFQLI